MAREDGIDKQTRYGEPVVPNLNVRQICPNCRSDPPNIIEEYSKGDLVRYTHISAVAYSAYGMSKLLMQAGVR